MSKLIPIIGLEVHVELKTKSKMFCGCENDPFIDTPNKNICETCTAQPGTLPVPNKDAIIWSARIAKALGCEINELCKFDRKHYFYPDLPKAYQISQYDQPIGEHGQIELIMNLLNSDKNHRDRAVIGVTRVHLEEDTAKLNHDTAGNTLVDFNRAGVPLVEIVSEPDVESGTEAKTYCQELQSIFRYLGVSDADMEKGQMRCEANISLQEEGKFEKNSGTIIPKGDYKLNAKVECKNINSFRAVEKAIDYEIKRQTEMILKGETWQQETRGWDENKQATVHQRFKETSADYRYFPEPDIPPFHPKIAAGVISLPELPIAKRLRFHNEFGFSYADAYQLTGDKRWAGFAESVISALHDWVHTLPETKACEHVPGKTISPTCKTAQDLVRLAGGWLTTKLAGAFKERNLDIGSLKIKAENFAELIALIFANRINSTNAQKILAEMLDSGVDLDPTHVMEEKGYGQISDEGKLLPIVEDIIKNNPKQVADFKAGKEPLIKFLVGMAMKATEGSADPEVTEKLLREKMK
ncbi:MAG: Asp-tRNA(Asn)/Glu-tRNA(Gln) amidotransferase subunit GatB [Patescibacteria group bacterium]|jgi:aspartyl-tRNA(Asn)/glutamyl-tRNA(Gln) amidotransferase subunit B